MHDATTSEPGLLPPLRRWWWLLVSAALVAGLASFALASQAEKTFEADAKLLVGPVNADYGTLQAAGQLGRTYAELAQSMRLVRGAAESAGVKLSRKDAETAVSASSNEITRVVELRVRNSDAKAAARMADALANALIALRREIPAQDTEPVDALMREAELERLTPRQREGVHTAARRVLGRTNAGQLEVIDRAEPPADPVAPKVGLLVLIGTLAGALAAAAFAILKEGSGRARELDSFALEGFLDGLNGSERSAPLEAVDEWIEGAREGGRS
jgi:uncharacterized protein involved in exopolysaccharide biosynthesis